MKIAASTIRNAGFNFYLSVTVTYFFYHFVYWALTGFRVMP